MIAATVWCALSCSLGGGIIIASWLNDRRQQSARFADVDALARRAKRPRTVESYIPDDGDEHRVYLGAC